ncbi:hypothetical protein FGO68_gene3187 [Halteria grandinella]|uniref:Fatty acid hydroxylase domain-containing protein n=1 Tax=Halteria grandinella TaxID=5974 RepID=A0A8J8NLX1_HALGN|nr:hypothetical protein FGO68_gene3187 [Halteria grandinella]
MIYWLDHPWFEQFKIQKDQAWYWKVDEKEWRERLIKTIQSLCFNNLVMVPFFLTIGVLQHDFQPEYSYKVEDLPSAWTFLWQTYVLVIIEDQIFTASHRLLHTPWFYKHIHKQHHTYTLSIGLCAEYSHPLEFFLGNILPLTIPATLINLTVGMHYWTMMWITAQRIASTTIGHSGYDFPFEPTELYPFKAYARYHDFHHGKNQNGNYGGGVILSDYIMGWNKEYYEHLDNKVYKGKGSPESKKKN